MALRHDLPHDNLPAPVAPPAGWRAGDLGDFLGMSDAEVWVIDLRVSVINAVKRARARAGLTQRQLAKRLGTSQPRVAKIESPAAADVSLDPRKTD